VRRWVNGVLVESQSVLPVGIPDCHPARELRPFDPKCEIVSRDFLPKGWELSIDLKAETGVGGAVGAQNGPAWRSVNSAVSYILEKLNSRPPLPDPTLTTRERNIIIRARHAAGVSQAELAQQFGISYQRVHQIVHRRRK
jgi:hypothetical protein